MKENNKLINFYNLKQIVQSKCFNYIPVILKKLIEIKKNLKKLFKIMKLILEN